MSEYAYKMFNKDLTCTRGRGTYQYCEGVWIEEEEANCARNGFHAALNPLDCLSYYPDWENSACYVVEIDGDIDEDGHDSKIACTRIRLDRQLTLSQFVAHACWYILQHANMPDSTKVKRDTADLMRGQYKKREFAVVRGKDPRARGMIGDVLGLVKEEEGSKEIEAAGAFTIDGIRYKPGIWYNAYGKRVKE